MANKDVIASFNKTAAEKFTMQAYAIGIYNTFKELSPFREQLTEPFVHEQTAPKVKLTM